MEACAVFSLRKDHADAVCQDTGPLDAAVGEPYQSDRHSALHVPADTLVRFLPFLREADSNALERCPRLDFNNSIQRGDKGGGGGGVCAYLS